MHETLILQEGSAKRDNKESSMNFSAVIRDEASRSMDNFVAVESKVRIYVPLQDNYLYFYLLKIDQYVTGETVLSQVLTQMQLPYSLVAPGSANSSSLVVVDNAEYFIVLKVGPPVLKATDKQVIRELCKQNREMRQ